MHQRVPRNQVREQRKCGRDCIRMDKTEKGTARTDQVFSTVTHKRCEHAVTCENTTMEVDERHRHRRIVDQRRQLLEDRRFVLWPGP